jgi:hypothetical protein
LFSPSKTNFIPKIQINYNNDGESDLTKFFDLHFINNDEKPVYKFLGVLIDPSLNFKYHIDHVSKKLSTSLYFLRSVKNMLNQRALKTIYYTIFHSQLIYAIQIWSCCPESSLKQIILKQKMAVRIISNAKYNSHTEPLFKNLEILPFKSLALFFKIQFMQNFVQNFLPEVFNNTWITNQIRRQDQAQVQLRNDDLLHIPFARTSTTYNLPLTSFPRIWSEFSDEEIKFQRNRIEFNQKLKKYFLDLLNSSVICSRLLCPECHLTV